MTWAAVCALYPETEILEPADAIEVARVDAQHHQILVVWTMTVLNGRSCSHGATKGANQLTNASKLLAGVHLGVLFCVAS